MIYTILSIAFTCCVVLVVHSYLLYPLFLVLSTSAGKKSNEIIFEENELPEIEILIAAYNEEKVIGEKLKSIFESKYPTNKIFVQIGSDSSTDKTNAIVEDFISRYPSQIKLRVFPGRTGKSGIINQLVEESTKDILLLSDANVLFTEFTLRELSKHFKNEAIKLVAANIIKVSPNNEGIASQEKSYLKMENRIKLLESIRWNAVMGAEGGCYTIRRVDFAPVPKNFFMDDFYITMNVLENKGKVIFEPDAICFEDVPNSGKEEYKRKVRISIGNFQNLKRYKALLWPFWKGKGFAFLSHKVLRWLTPFLLIKAFLILSVLCFWGSSWLWLWLGELFLFSTPLLNFIFERGGMPVPLIRYFGHFIHMNLALLKGFFLFVKGVETNVWTPTQRNK